MTTKSVVMDMAMEMILRSFSVDPKEVSKVELVGKNQYKVLMKDGKTVKLGGREEEEGEEKGRGRRTEEKVKG